MVDASALVEWLLPGPRYDEVQDLFEDDSNSLLAPDLIFVEAANAFRKLWLNADLSSEDLEVALEDLSAIDVMTATTEALLPLLRPLLEDLSAYDATYLTLALVRGIPIATFDRVLAEAAAVRGVPLSLGS